MLIIYKILLRVQIELELEDFLVFLIKIIMVCILGNFTLQKEKIYIHA